MFLFCDKWINEFHKKAVAWGFCSSFFKQKPGKSLDHRSTSIYKTLQFQKGRLLFGHHQPKRRESLVNSLLGITRTRVNKPTVCVSIASICGYTFEFARTSLKRNSGSVSIVCNFRDIM